jgi:hypothetical protein
MVEKRPGKILSPEIYEQHERIERAVKARLELLAKREAERKAQAQREKP